MQVKIIKMFKQGIEVPRRMLTDRSTVQHRGNLVISDVTDQGRHRPTKVARVINTMGTVCELWEVSLVWANEGRITLTGDERLPNEQGQLVYFKQSWLVTLDTELVMIGTPRRKTALT